MCARVYVCMCVCVLNFEIDSHYVAHVRFELSLITPDRPRMCEFPDSPSGLAGITAPQQVSVAFECEENLLKNCG